MGQVYTLRDATFPQESGDHVRLPEPENSRFGLGPMLKVKNL